MKLRTLITNFYIRNTFILFVILSYCFLFATAQALEVSVEEHIHNTLFCLYIFSWDLFQNKVLHDFFFLKKKYILFSIGHVIGMMLLFFVSNTLFNRPYTMHQLYLNGFTYFNNVVIVSSVYLSYKYIIEKDTLYQLNILKRDIELQQLKAQLNPHFLFNALNNIYSYTLESNKYGNELILKLSELMRFILDASEKEMVSISDEIQFLENYINFETERLGRRCVINYQKKVDFPDRLIAPLLLFPFIENAFKYGANTIKKTEIEISINDDVEVFRIIVKNTIANEKPISTKKGLPNAHRRLEILYPNHHKLDISTQDNQFIIDLIVVYDKD